MKMVGGVIKKLLFVKCDELSGSKYSVTCVKAFTEPQQRLRKEDAANFCHFGQGRYFNSYMEVWPSLLNFGEFGAKDWAMQSKTN